MIVRVVMEFCPKCGAILVQKKTKYGCPRCNYVSKDKIKVQTKEKIGEKQSVGVVDSKEGKVDPKVDWNCPKCKNKKAYYRIQQMRSGDEPESQFYECTKCGWTERSDR